MNEPKPRRKKNVGGFNMRDQGDSQLTISPRLTRQKVHTRFYADLPTERDIRQGNGSSYVV